MPASRYIFGTLPWYSVLVVTGMLAAILLSTYNEKKAGLPKDTIVDLALWVIPFGVIGARLYYVIFAWKSFAENPISALFIWQGGLAIYGGIIGGALAICLYARRKKISVLGLMDIVVPGVVLAQAIGRWGNFFNMEAYGEVINDPALQFFPLAVLIPESNGYVWHMATFFYESVWNVCTFLVLERLFCRKHKKGDILLCYLLMYGAGRLVIEGFRTDSLMSFSNTFRVSMLLSGLLCLVANGLFLYYAVQRSQRRKLWLIPAWVLQLALLIITCIYQEHANAIIYSAYALVLGAVCMHMKNQNAIE